MQEPYQAVVVEGKWGSLDEFLDDDEGFTIAYSVMTVAKDTALHIAVHSKSEQPLKKLLDRVGNNEHIRDNILNTTNIYENTVLHEAAINHNIKAVKHLVENGYVTDEHLLKRNESGQTPLFKAAAFGSTKVVKYLASRPNQTIASTGYKKLKDAHRVNNDGFSILHAAERLYVYWKWTKGIPTGDYDNYDDANTMDEDKYDVLVQYVDEVGDNHISEDDDDEVGDNQSIPTGDYFVQYVDEVGDNYISEDDDDEVGDNQNGKWPTIVTEIWKEKRKRKFAFMLARKLIKIDYSWEMSCNEDTSKNYKPNLYGQKETQSVPKVDDPTMKQLPAADQQTNQIGDTQEVETPLLAATRTGVIELVKEILKKHPQAVEHVSHNLQNILHVAASYRRKDIFEHVVKMKIPTRRLIMGIDKDGYSVLHHVADNSNYNGGTRPGPAYQLQEELEWFQMVEEIMPSYFTQHLENKSGKSMTAKQLFREMHQKQLEDAQKWIKETSQSCSAVAVLVATVVFAAAFTVPGGNDEKEGFPLLIHSPFFMSFTLTDVVSLSCSLTALVMFLSIVTSPFDLENFHVSLPRRLTLGFAMLFMSVLTTMLTFTSTIILIIQGEHRQEWTLTLMISCIAFVPVSVLALTHFPLFHSFIRAWKNIFKFIWNAPPFRFLHK
ncbi:hypothetical protein LWI29_015677 [Acer saccharum]|uniref:PGG domain-containing protein n=1 Tax=Acer saccharum TaxID=4024 RepID=A0AA39RQ56_ACESA|nr:hypothetical protein LWI29_015677 [Acer saccharum]